MSRIASLLLAAALAGCGSSSSTTPVEHSTDTAGGELAVVLADAAMEDMSVSRTLAAAPGSRFPAVSVDGTTIVDLVLDQEDFSAIPIATVVFWTRTGAVASFQLASTMTEGAVPADQTAREESTLAQANARLAETRWDPLPKVAATGEDPETGGAGTLVLGGGVTIQLATVIDRFPAPGTGSEEIGGGGCGEITGLAEGYGSREIGFAVVYPTVNLGGDSCYGSPGAELAIVVPI